MTDMDCLIAGYPVRIHGILPENGRRYLPYRSEGIGSSATELTGMLQNCVFDGVDDPVRRQLLVHARQFADAVTRNDGLILHASCVMYDGKAYCFAAHSGTGKSTHTALWRQVIGEEQVVVLNDDKPALRPENGVWYAYGTPWSGKTDLNMPLRAKLAGICVINQGTENRIRRTTPDEMLFRMYDLLEQFREPEIFRQTLRKAGALLESVPVWEMQCNTDTEAARVSFSAMTGRESRV